MIKKRIIPCLLLKKGRCVKGVNFKDHRDTGHPVTNAKIYDAQGADELIFLNIEARYKDRDLLLDIIRKTADECFMPLTVGGGVRTLDDIKKLLRAGADKVSINTAAFENPEFINKAAMQYGKQCIIISIDYKKNSKGENEVFTNSGTKSTGINPLSWAKKAVKRGAGEILLTNIDKEGTRTGYDLKVIKMISDAVNIPVIASGGAGSLENLKKAFIETNASAVSLATILHFTDQNVIKARNYLKTAGINIRFEI